MRCNIIVGGPAGAGPNFVSNLLSKALVQKGFNVFSSREYESRIRGGHNYNMVTFSEMPVNSNITNIDLLIALDDLAESSHKSEINKKTIVLKGNSNNAFLLGSAAKVLGIEYMLIDNLLKDQSNYDADSKEAKEGYDSQTQSISLPILKKTNSSLMSGSEGVAIGAINSDLDFYYAYPMTPATTVLFELAARESQYKYKTVELESEIACVNAAVGSSIMGKKSMVGTSGGGFDLMTETLSMIGIAEIPLVFYIAQRVGPGTGAATSQSQGDLFSTLYSGHGEFSRVVASPGDALDSAELTSQLFYLSQKFKIPVMVLSDKHLAEALFTVSTKPKFSKSISTIKWPTRFTSYEANENAEATGRADIIQKNVLNRTKKDKSLSADVEKMQTFKLFGNKKTKNLIIGWGSTKGAILDSMSELNANFLQVLYLNPFSESLKREIKKAENLIIVENNSTSLLSQLIQQKCLINIPEKNKILKFNGRPFFSDELTEEIKKRLI